MISIVIPCRNESEHIVRLLECLRRQEWGEAQWEAIVADGMSDDGTRETLARFASMDSRITVIDNPERIVSTGLNRAIRASRGDIILRMDAHSEYAPDYVRQCVRVLEETGADNVGGPARTKARGLIGRAIAAAYHSPYSTGGAKFHKDGYEGPTDTVVYGCWRKATLIAIGLFDESLVRNQDDELNLRTVRSGGRLWQSPKIRSWYRPRNSLTALFRQYYQYGFWKVAVIRKHRLPASVRHLVPGAFVLANIVFPLGLLGIVLVGIGGGALYAKAWAAFVALYFGASIVASVLTPSPTGGEVRPVLPLVYATYHFSYGLGFLVGAVYFLLIGRGAPQVPGAFTQLSR
jgi:glycosyltransferase involved in cell wall biosynthesis